MPRFAIACFALAACATPPAAPRVSFATLLAEMADRPALARLPAPAYTARCATSYNRASVQRDQPGWFADSDGTGFVREETHQGRREWVLMEDDGPGCLVHLWTPFFFHDYGDRIGARLRIYLDGSEVPVIDAPMIELLTQNDWPDSYGAPPPRRDAPVLPLPFAGFSARAGNLYLPIPFARSCKVTLDARPFYYRIESRAYAAGTAVETFTPAMLAADLTVTTAALTAPLPHPTDTRSAVVDRATPLRWHLDAAAAGSAVDRLGVQLPAATLTAHPELLRSLVLRVVCDGEECVWCPLGDFFGSANALHPFATWMRSVTADGGMSCRWVMPFARSADVELLNLTDTPVTATLSLSQAPWTWDERSMHFHAGWRPDDVLPGDRFEDWNFVDIRGQGVFVGDAWTVLNLTDGWWGEGDDKIYVDGSCARGFPDQFGTGSEDYYGWAGGVNPTRADRFAQPFLANLSVGSTAVDSTRGFDICTRERALDAIPFAERLVFDMEASPGTDQRHAWDLLGYSAVVFWYGRPGASSNRGAEPAAAARGVPSLEALQAQSAALRAAK